MWLPVCDTWPVHAKGGQLTNCELAPVDSHMAGNEGNCHPLPARN